MKTQTLIATTLAAPLMSAPLLAGGYNDVKHRYRDYAKVLDVTPIYQTVEVSTPRQECWDEEVTHTTPGRRSATPVIFGTIIGGVIGNQIGDGRGKKLATVAGSILGASIGSDNAHANAQQHSYTATAQRCRVTNDYYTEERVSGYNVKYRYHGRVYETRMDRQPGKRIPVAVAVTPIY